MKRWVWVLALAIGGCSTVSDINQTPPTLNVISGKKPEEYAKCLSARLADSRGALQLEANKSGGYRVIVPQSLSPAPAAIFYIDERSGGSSIKLHEQMSNNPLRPGDVLKAGERCISG
ncbi:MULTISPECIES: hypothetical protein [Pseudomonas]|uniref:Lipoprotein n=1 Tax=Pseudomonas piscis TaxID=2614538 RepID=A0ABY9N9W6_9PSED|nr:MULTISPECIES: hypothetical protein [Pseudomonas]AZC19033.1 hypothetical protein C4K40_3645 [Pseudomonas sp. CMR5c]ERO65644.1 hypothetical protein P308_17965 [Pseudomonas piscis]MCU7647027.1 hypothetical protein [Pseudomonas piscis]POA52188.1 hypothetical protein C1889_23515 [Pseudomonas sp. FW507-12TSA]WMN15279.1 hypothetical protein QL104_18085 [Pseudomonas piscis]